MLIRILLFFATFAFLIWLGLWFLRRRLVKWLQSFQPTPGGTSPLDATETLVKCAYCNTFVPKNRAIEAKERFFCCEEHASLSQ